MNMAIIKRREDLNPIKSFWKLCKELLQRINHASESQKSNTKVCVCVISFHITLIYNKKAYGLFKTPCQFSSMVQPGVLRSASEI